MGVLFWAAIFFIITIIAGVLGFGGFFDRTGTLTALWAFGISLVIFFILAMAFSRKKKGPKL